MVQSGLEGNAADCPRVSLFHMTYNQTEGLREAVEASLAQDYPNLEIVFSDDCSTDGTFEIVQSVVDGYNGPHTVRVTRNSENLGTVANFNTLMEKTSGRYIVQTNGDDVSTSNRVSRLVAQFLEDPERMLVLSAGELVGHDGKVYDRILCRPQSFYDLRPVDYIFRRVCATGAYCAYNRVVFDRYGPVPPYARVEDHIMPFRARTLGTVHILDETLVVMRPGGISWDGTTEKEYQASQRKKLKIATGNIRAFLRDLKTIDIEGRNKARFYLSLRLLAFTVLPSPRGTKRRQAQAALNRLFKRYVLRL